MAPLQYGLSDSFGAFTHRPPETVKDPRWQALCVNTLSIFEERFTDKVSDSDAGIDVNWPIGRAHLLHNVIRNEPDCDTDRFLVSKLI